MDLLHEGDEAPHDGGGRILKRAALVFLASASLLILASFVPGLSWGPKLFAILAVAFPIALIVLGASRGGRLGPLVLPVLALLLILEGCLAGMLVFEGRVLEAIWVGGLPLAAALQIYGMWLAPLALVAFAYALSFDSFHLRQEDLERIERLMAERPEPAQGS